MNPPDKDALTTLICNKLLDQNLLAVVKGHCIVKGQACKKTLH